MTWRDPDNILKALALLGAAAAFIAGLLQYQRAQQWKRAEWVAQEMRELFDDPLVQAVLLMIDWGERRIPLYPDKAEPERYVSLTNDEIAQALMPHDREKAFTEREVDIRAAFDRFLDGPERFHSYVETKLVTDEDLWPYLHYWAETIFREGGSEDDRLARLRAYMEKYGYGGARALMKRLAKRSPRNTKDHGRDVREQSPRRRMRRR